MPSTEKEKASEVKATKSSHKDRVRHLKNGTPELPHLSENLELDLLIGELLEGEAQTNAESDSTARKSTRDKEAVISSGGTSSTESDSMRSNGPCPIYNLLDESTSSSEVGSIIDAESAEESSNIVQKHQVSPAATEGDGLSARKPSRLIQDYVDSSSTETHESNHRQTSNNIQATPTTLDWYNEFLANKPTTSSPISETNTQMATLQEEMELLKQHMRKLQDRLQCQEETLLHALL